jgi:CheY-like chemotaxis protein
MSKHMPTRLLLVEDNPGDARMIREMLNDQDSYATQLTLVESMSDAERRLSKGDIDIILLDLGLPDAQGLEAVHRAQAAAPRIPLVVLTGLQDESQSGPALRAGAEDYLIKGEIETRGLLRALRYAVERRIMEEELFAERELAEVTLNSIADAVMSSDNLGLVTYMNLTAEDLTGWRLSEAVGRPVADVFRGVDRDSRQATPQPCLGESRTGTDRVPRVELHADRARPTRDRDRRQCLADSR